MPHDNIQLAQAPNGEIGPRCKKCGVRMTFGAAMVIKTTTTVGNVMLKSLVRNHQQK